MLEVAPMGTHFSGGSEQDGHYLLWILLDFISLNFLCLKTGLQAVAVLPALSPAFVGW